MQDMRRKISESSGEAGRAMQIESVLVFDEMMTLFFSTLSARAAQ
jgi:hypothetical protein